MMEIKGMVQTAGKREMDKHRSAGAGVFVLKLRKLLSHISCSFYWGQDLLVDPPTSFDV